MEKSLVLAAALFLCAAPAAAADGVIDVPSSFGVAETADRLEGVLAGKGMTVFNRILHSGSAAKVGVELRPTELLIFGNPAVGSPLMKCRQGVALDLPQKALIWEDGQGVVRISYNDPRYLEKRHGITGCEEVLAKIEKALAAIVQAAAGP